MIDTQAYIKFTDLISELNKEQLKELVNLINEYLRVDEYREKTNKNTSYSNKMLK